MYICLCLIYLHLKRHTITLRYEKNALSAAQFYLNIKTIYYLVLNQRLLKCYPHYFNCDISLLLKKISAEL